MSRAPARSAAELARPEVRAFRAYTLDLSPCRFKLDQNEVPWEPPPALKAEAARRLAASAWARYPDFHADALRAKLAARHGWTADGVLVGNGSNELLAATLAAVAGPGSTVTGLLPGFGLYPVFVLATGARYEPLGPRADLALPWAELEAAVEREPRRPVIVASPNNPTGEAIAPGRIARLAARLEAPLLLDNAYAEFCRHDYRPLLAAHPNLVIFRTFSKAWSLAGIRLGYLLGDPALVAEILKVKLPYNLGHAGAAIGELALDWAAAAERRVKQLVRRRPAWTDLLAGFGAEVFPSEANFVLTRWPEREFGLLSGGLESHGIRVRNVSTGPGLARCLRISVAGGAALRAMKAALESLLGTSGDGGPEKLPEKGSR